jgi:hypothetical protein
MRTSNNELTLESKKIVACFLQGVIRRVGLELHKHNVLYWHFWGEKKNIKKHKNYFDKTSFCSNVPYPVQALVVKD